MGFDHSLDTTPGASGSGGHGSRSGKGSEDAATIWSHWHTTGNRSWGILVRVRRVTTLSLMRVQLLVSMWGRGRGACCVAPNLGYERERVGESSVKKIEGMGKKWVWRGEFMPTMPLETLLSAAMFRFGVFREFAEAVFAVRRSSALNIEVKKGNTEEGNI